MLRDEMVPVKAGVAGTLGAKVEMSELLSDSDGYNRMLRERRFRMWVATAGIAAFGLFCLMMVR